MAASSASCKRSRLPSNLVNGQELTMCDIVWISPQSHNSLSVKPLFLWHALQWPWPVRKRFSSWYSEIGLWSMHCIASSHVRYVDIDSLAQAAACLSCISTHMHADCRAWYCYGKSVCPSIRHMQVLYLNECTYCQALSTICKGHDPSFLDRYKIPRELPRWGIVHTKGGTRICSFQPKLLLISETE